jgi:peptidoglycan/xylan/chitin deacetylase (PgdA/CDA1 family)
MEGKDSTYRAAPADGDVIGEPPPASEESDDGRAIPATMSRRRFFAVSAGVAAMASLLPTRTARASGGPPHVAFTWDGPWATMFNRGFPRLRAHGFPATAYVITGRVGQSGAFLEPDATALEGPVQNDRICTWEEIQTLNAAGWEISNHTVTHTNLAEMGHGQLVQEIQGAKKELVSRGFPCPGFAYPGNHQDALARSVVARFQEYGRIGGKSIGLSDISSVDELFLVPAIRLSHLTGAQMIAITRRECFSDGRDLVWLGHLVRPPSQDRPEQVMSVSGPALSKYLDWVAQEKRAGRLVATTCRNLVRKNLLGS